MNIIVKDAPDALKLIANWLEHGGKIPEPERAKLHELTRAVRMSDEDLDDMIDRDLEIVGGAILGILCDLRDRYEGLGKYAAPAQPHRKIQ